MSDLNELKELMDVAEAKAKECENAWRRAEDIFSQLKSAYEKERDKDKTCDACRYNIALDFSDDGWHNLCGNPKGSCTCCHSRCDEFAPDTSGTLAIKQFYRTQFKREPNLDPEFIVGLKLIGFDVYDDNFGDERARRLIEVLKARQGIK